MEEGGIYILVTPGEKQGLEYRVTHAYSTRGLICKDRDGVGDSSVNKVMLRKMFGRCQVFTDKCSADAYADKAYYRYEMSDPFLVAAGVNCITLDKPYSFYGGKGNAKKEDKKGPEGKSGKKSGKSRAKNR